MVLKACSLFNCAFCWEYTTKRAGYSPKTYEVGWSEGDGGGMGRNFFPMSKVPLLFQIKIKMCQIFQLKNLNTLTVNALHALLYRK